MSFEEEKDGERRRKSEHLPDSEAPSKTRAKTKKPTESPEIGSALRSVYDRAMKEAIPPEMLDLLGKLG